MSDIYFFGAPKMITCRNSRSYNQGISFGNPGQASGNSLTRRTAAEKRAWTCQAWNEGGCTKAGRDSNHCGFGKNALQHGCAKVIDKYQICWDKGHTEAEHK